jgi:putative ABC transport system permease protein
MRKLRAFLIRAANFLRGRDLGREMDQQFAAELESHIDLHTEEGVRAGLAREEARRQALIELGGVEQTRQAYRERVTIPLLDGILKDLRFALRQMRKSPGFALTAVLTLALAMGANSAVFALVHAILLRQLPFDGPERVLDVDKAMPVGLGFNFAAADHNFAASFNAAARSLRTIEAAALYTTSGVNFSMGSGTAERLHAAETSAQFLRVLGVTPHLGRGFLAEEEIPGKDHVVLISDRLWRSRWNADPAVIGKTVRINAFDFTIVGVLPPRMDFPAGTDLWAPTIFDEETSLRESGAVFTQVVARAKPDQPIDAVRAEFTARASSMNPNAPSGEDMRPVLTPIAAQLTKSIRASLLMLSLAVSLMLLVACSNLAALALARAARQQGEFAVRTALGATQGRLVRQQLVEFLSIAVAGGLLGLLVTQGILQMLYILKPAALEYFPRPALDPVVLGFTALVAVLAGLVFGFVPAWVAARTQPAAALKLGAATHSGHGARFRKALVAGEVAVAFLLLSAAGLLLRTMKNLNDVPLGYNVQGILSFSVSLHGAPYFKKDDAATPALADFYTAVLSRLSALPGAQGAAAVSILPLEKRADMLLPVTTGAAGEKPVAAAPRFASSGYFGALGIPIVAGRDFSPSDNRNSERVAILSRDLADKLWPGRNPIGRQLHCLWYCEKPTVVVGIVPSGRHYGPRGSALAEYYMPYTQQDWPYMTFLVRTGSNPAALAPAARAAVAAIDPAQAIYNVETMQQRLDDNESLVRFELFTLSAFAVFSVLLVLIGLYGVVSYSVAQRTREIGIRIALGSQRGPILRSLIWESAAVTLAGAAAGLGASLVFLRLLSRVLFGVTPHDPRALGGTALCFLAASIAAAWLPARRAAAINPITALHAE